MLFKKPPSTVIPVKKGSQCIKNDLVTLRGFLSDFIQPFHNLELMDDHQRFMKLALKEAEEAYEANEIPVGAVIVKSGTVIAKAHNQVELLQDPTAHAEIIAIGAAANHLSSWRLNGCTLYVTLEPCPMCAGAIVLSRLDRVAFGAYDPKMGACSTLYNVVQDERLNHRVELIAGILDEDSRILLREFFEKKRRLDEK